jgi:hypothetical protein
METPVTKPHTPAFPTLCSLRSQGRSEKNYRGSRHIDQNCGPPLLI